MLCEKIYQNQFLTMENGSWLPVDKVEQKTENTAKEELGKGETLRAGEKFLTKYNPPGNTIGQKVNLYLKFLIYR